MSTQIAKFCGSLDVSSAAALLGSGQAQVAAAYQEQLSVDGVLVTNLTLSSDSPVSVSLGPLSGVNLLSIRAVGGKIRVRVTSSDGSSQALPVDPVLVLMSDSVDITAIDLTRTADIETEVFIVMAEKG